MNAYDDNRSLTKLFQALAQTNDPNFGLEVKLEKSCWVKGTNIDVSDIIHGFNTYFKYSVGGGIWVDTDARDEKIISLTMKVNHLSNNGTKAVKSMTDTATPNKDFYACPKWRIKKKGETSKDTDYGAPVAWCTYLKSQNVVVNGIYVPKLHNHHDWVAKRTKRQADWNANKREGKGADVVSPVNTPTNSKAVSNLELSKSFKSDLVTKL